MPTNARKVRTNGLRQALAAGAVALATLTSVVAPAIAQPAGAGQAEAVPATWSTPRLERLGTMLSGNWKTDASIPIPGSTTGDSANIVISIAPVGIDGMSDAMYMEIARADQMWAPYRQAVLQLFEYKGNIRLRTYEFHNANVDKGAFVGAWAMPEAFPILKADNFIATLDIEGSDSSGGFIGRTPAAYPTRVGGAVEMTSAIELSANRLVTEDRGFDAQGNVVWGQEQGGRYVYSKVSPENVVTSVRRDSDGLVVIAYNTGVGNPGAANDTIAVHYTGWFARNSSVFDSSRSRGVPFSYQLPGQMIQGWLRGTEGFKAGERRRVFIPYLLGYGEAGQPPRMPARSNLIFDVECLTIQPTPQAPTNPSGARPTPPPATDTER